MPVTSHNDVGDSRREEEARVVPVGRALLGSLGVLVVLLAGLSVATGMTALAWVVGLACGALVLAGTGRLARGRGPLGPADLVTLTRATLTCAVAALVADAWPGSPVAVLLVTLSSVALVLDAVDGRVARATGRSTGFGPRFDGEADAFLLVVLCVPVAQTHGAWVLAIGAARYVFWVAGVAWPWLRRALPRRDWRKVVTAVQGIVLVVAAAGVVPRGVMQVVLAAALTLLVESFGRDVLWLVRHRHDAVPEKPHGPARAARQAAG